MTEIWKDYIYNYQISNLGNIRNKITGKVLKLNPNGNGYLGASVSLGSRGKNKCIRVHRAVAETFIPNPNNLPQVNHIDGNKKNNKVDNLEWCDNQYNSIHAIKTGLHIPLSKEKNPNVKLTESDAHFIKQNYKPRDRQFGIRGLARKFNVHHETIRHILTGESWK